MSEKKRKFKLKNLTIEEISGVDRPANPEAKVLFFKREKETDMSKIEELAEKLEKLEENQDSLKAENETLKAENALSDDERTFYKGLEDDKVKAEFLKADADARAEMIEKAAFRS